MLAVSNGGCRGGVFDIDVLPIAAAIEGVLWRPTEPVPVSVSSLSPLASVVLVGVLGTCRVLVQRRLRLLCIPTPYRYTLAVGAWMMNQWRLAGCWCRQPMATVAARRAGRTQRWKALPDECKRWLVNRWLLKGPPSQSWSFPPRFYNQLDAFSLI